MQNVHFQYPDISDIITQKAAGRRQRAAISFAEKLVILDELKERVQPIIQARMIRRQQQIQSASQQGEQPFKLAAQQY